MKRKLSNKAKVSISNAQHNKLARKCRYNFMDTPKETDAKRSLVKAYYHEDVVHKQTYLGRLLTKEEKRLTFLARKNSQRWGD